MAVRRRRQPYDPHRWDVVHVAMRCHLGDHDVASGTWVRTRKGDYRQFHACEDCLRERGVTRPTRAVVFRGDAPLDVRARQAGEDR